MSLIEKLPEMEDGALIALHANAERLAQSGSASQKKAAVELLPPLEIEIAERKEAAKLAKTRRMKAARETAALKKAEAKAEAEEQQKD